MSEYPRGRDRSGALDAVRTVLSRAETAIDEVGREHLVWDGNEVVKVNGNLKKERDPDADEMIGALLQVVNLLDHWRRTGRTKR